MAYLNCIMAYLNCILELHNDILELHNGILELHKGILELHLRTVNVISVCSFCLLYRVNRYDCVGFLLFLCYMFYNGSSKGGALV